MASPSSADDAFFSAAVFALYLLPPLTFLPLIFTTAPYGKHSRSGWGPSIPPAIAWFLMESPTLFLPPLLLLLLSSGRHLSNPLALLVLSLFLLHYLHRTLIYPLRLQISAVLSGSGSGSSRSGSSGSGSSRSGSSGSGSSGSRSGVPLSVIAMGFGFNLLNAYAQTRSATHYADYSSRAWTAGIWTAGRAAIGIAIYGWGMAVNVRSDLALMRLKREGRGGYGIPRGGWFERVSCPNYMGELAEWTGWAVVAWSPAAFGFVVCTAGNLVPRARSYHKWYLEKFGEDYPRSRKAIVPYVF